MEARKLEIHTFYLTDVKNDNIKINPKNIFGRDLFKLLVNEFPDFIEKYPPLKLYGKTTKIPKSSDHKYIFDFNKNNRYVYGKINIGDDNKKVQDVVASDKAKTFLYTKEKGHSVERPFFFMIILPENKEVGFLILEREGKHAMKQDFAKILNEFSSEKLSDVKIKFANFIEADLVKEWLIDGDYKEITLTRKYIPNDVAEHYGEYLKEGKFDVKLSIIPKENTFFSSGIKKRIAENINEYNGFFESEDLKDLGFDKNSELKVVVDHKGNTRTIDLSDTKKVRPYYHVIVETDYAGFSEFKSIRDEALKLMRSFDLNIL